MTKPDSVLTTVMIAVEPNDDHPTTRSPESSTTWEVRNSVKVCKVETALDVDSVNWNWPTEVPEQL